LLLLQLVEPYLQRCLQFFIALGLPLPSLLELLAHFTMHRSSLARSQLC